MNHSQVVSILRQRKNPELAALGLRPKVTFVSPAIATVLAAASVVDRDGFLDWTSIDLGAEVATALELPVSASASETVIRGSMDVAMRNRRVL